MSDSRIYPGLRVTVPLDAERLRHVGTIFHERQCGKTFEVLGRRITTGLGLWLVMFDEPVGWLTGTNPRLWWILETFLSKMIDMKCEESNGET